MQTESPIQKVEKSTRRISNSSDTVVLALLVTIIPMVGIFVLFTWLDISWALPFDIIGPMIGIEMVVQYKETKRQPFWGNIVSWRDKTCFLVGFVIYGCLALLPARIETTDEMVAIGLIIWGFIIFSIVVYIFGTGQLKRSFFWYTNFWIPFGFLAYFQAIS